MLCFQIVMKVILSVVLVCRWDFIISMLPYSILCPVKKLFLKRSATHIRFTIKFSSYSNLYLLMKKNGTSAAYKC